MPVLRHPFTLTKKDYKGNGIFTKKFKDPVTFDSKKNRVSIESFQIYNSFYNIRKEYNNNLIRYTWINGETLDIVLDDGYYDVTYLDYVVKQKLIDKNWYWYDKEKQNYNFCHNFESIVNLYTHRISFFYFPDQTLFTEKQFNLPDGVNWTVPNVKKHVIIDLGGLNKYFGQTQTIFPPVQDQNKQVNLFYDSVQVPELLIVDYIFICCNLINSPYNIESDFMTQIRINNEFGGLVSKDNGMEQRYSIADGVYKEVTIKVMDDDFLPIKLKDPNMTINLIIETEIKE